VVGTEADWQQAHRLAAIGHFLYRLPPDALSADKQLQASLPALLQLYQFAAKPFLSTRPSSTIPVEAACCLVGLLKQEAVARAVEVPGKLLEGIGEFLKMGEEPLSTSARQAFIKALPWLISLAAAILPTFPYDILPNYMMGVGDLASKFSVAKLPAVDFVARSCLPHIVHSAQERVLTSTASLLKQLLFDDDWLVCGEMMAGFKYFAHFSSYPPDVVKRMLPVEARSFVLPYLSGQPYPLTPAEKTAVWEGGAIYKAQLAAHILTISSSSTDPAHNATTSIARQLFAEMESRLDTLSQFSVEDLRLIAADLLLPAQNLLHRLDQLVIFISQINPPNHQNPSNNDPTQKL
jgi:hypothetical protein